jgi:hypothetical protein
MHFTDLLNVCRAGLLVDFKGPVTVTQNCLCNGNPWIIVAENTSIFFISGRIGRDLAKL